MGACASALKMCCWTCCCVTGGTREDYDELNDFDLRVDAYYKLPRAERERRARLLGAIATGLVDEARRLRAESPAVPVDALGIGLRRYRWGDGREEKEVGFRHDNVDFARDEPHKTRWRLTSQLVHAATHSSDENVAALEDVLSLNPEIDARGLGLATALMVTSSVAAAQLLLRRGARVNARDSRGWTALHRCAMGNGGAALARLFLREGADPNALDNGGRTPLFEAARHDRSGEVVRALLDSGADPFLGVGSNLPIALALPQNRRVLLSAMVLRARSERERHRWAKELEEEGGNVEAAAAATAAVDAEAERQRAAASATRKQRALERAQARDAAGREAAPPKDDAHTET